MRQFFSLEGPLMRALSDLTTLVALNLLTLLCSVPIITAGAALTALNDGVMRVIDGEGNIIKRYFKRFKSEIRQATPVWIVFLAIAAFLYVDTLIFGKPSEDTGIAYGLIPVWALIFVAGCIFVWTWPLIARIETGFAGSLANAARLAVGAFPRTVVMVVICGLCAFVFANEMRILPIAFLLGLSLPTYLCALVYKPKIDAIIENMSGLKTDEEDNDEKED